MRVAIVWLVVGLVSCSAPNASTSDLGANEDEGVCLHPDYYFRDCCEDEGACERVGEGYYGTSVVLSLDEICAGDCIPTLTEALASPHCLQHGTSEALSWVWVDNMGDATSEFSGGWFRTLFYDTASGELQGVIAEQWEGIPGYQLGGCCGPFYRAGEPGEGARLNPETCGAP